MDKIEFTGYLTTIDLTGSFLQPIPDQRMQPVWQRAVARESTEFSQLGQHHFSSSKADRTERAAQAAAHRGGVRQTCYCGENMQTAQNASVVSGPMHFSSTRPRGRRPDSPSPAVGSGWVRLWLLVAATVLIGCAIAAFSVDCSVAQWFHQCHMLKHLRYLHDLASISEIFGRGECVLLVAILMWRLDRSRHWAIPGVVATALLSGLAADGVKMLIARARPHQFRLPGQRMEQFWAVAALGFVGQCEPELSFGPHGHGRRLAISLMCIYPAARGLFCVLPLLVAFQRMDSGAHFLSDVLCGAAVGCLVAALTLRARWLDQQLPSGSGGEWGRSSRALRSDKRQHVYGSRLRMARSRAGAAGSRPSREAVGCGRRAPSGHHAKRGRRRPTMKRPNLAGLVELDHTLLCVSQLPPRLDHLLHAELILHTCRPAAAICRARSGWLSRCSAQRANPARCPGATR